MRYLLEKYNEHDIANVPENTRLAAEAFIDLLIDTERERAGEYAYVDWIKVVPYGHIGSWNNDKDLCIIYEEVADLAEQIQLGYKEYAKEHDALMAIQDKYDVLFECYNSWSCGVYADR